LDGDVRVACFRTDAHGCPWFLDDGSHFDLWCAGADTIRNRPRLLQVLGSLSSADT
jgi:hypothetical protein